MRHAETMQRRFENWEKDWRECDADFADLQQAFKWALSTRTETDRWRLAWGLAFRGYFFANRRGQLPEAYEFMDQVARVAEQTEDRDLLQRCYIAQALILQDWGRLDEAMTLHKKQEAICEELGNRDDLQRSYGNQALILQAWGRLDEAMALHKKREAICEELGNRSNLAICYDNQAHIALQRKQCPEARRLATQSLAIFRELKMPSQIDSATALLAAIDRQCPDQSRSAAT